MESFNFTPIVIALVGSIVLTAVVFVVLVIRDRPPS